MLHLNIPCEIWLGDMMVVSWDCWYLGSMKQPLAVVLPGRGYQSVEEVTIWRWKSVEITAWEEVHEASSRRDVKVAGGSIL